MTLLDDHFLPLGGKPRRKDVRWRVQDATAFLARAMVTRAVRIAGVHQLLRGGPGLVGLLLTHPEDAATLTSAAFRFLKETSRDQLRGDWRAFNWSPQKPRRLATTWEEHLAEGDRDVCRVIAVTDVSDGLPLSFLAAADGAVEIGRPDAQMLRAAFRALGARDPGVLPDDRDLAAIPLGAYASVLRRGHSSGAAAKIARLADACAEAKRRNSPNSGVEGPSLADLHGLGEAADWGRQLAVDLADLKAGNIGWRDVDRGILLSGPPGTGKTTFARALGKTCGVPVFVHSLARWQAAGYLNDLLRAMQSAFAEAQAAAPAILFVDELDSFGDRAKLEGKNAQYSREVINGFLECVDGADRREGVIVVGATNDISNVDPAIGRPGRLDRHVEISLPDAAARAKILRFHLGSDLSDVDLPTVARPLEGLSGAALEHAVRGARRLARTARRQMNVDDLIGGLPKGVTLSDEAFERACWHEAGHLTVGAILARETGVVPVEARVSRTAHADDGGVTHFSRDQGFARTRESYLGEITVYVSGIAAERLRFGTNGHGAGGSRGSDLHRATGLAIAIEASLGLGDRLAYVAELGSDALFAHVQRDPPLRSTVEATLQSCLARATDLLGRHRGGLETVARILAEEGEATLADAFGALGSESCGSGNASC